MIYIAVGMLGFLIAYTFDWVSIKQLPSVIKQLVGLLAIGLLSYATVMVCIKPTKLEFPAFLLPLGVVLLLLSLSLLIYSLFIEIPFSSTYANKGTGNKLVDTGTYALVRHPGVIWLALFYIALIILFPSLTMLIAAIIWIIMDIIWVLLQDRIFFPKMFPEYPVYKKQTPFLIPTRQSITACLRTISSGRQKQD